VSRKTLPILFALALLDIALWHWSLGGGHRALALLAGVTLPPLSAAVAWLAFVSAARLLAKGARRPAARLRTRTGASARLRGVRRRPRVVAASAPARGARRARTHGEEPERRLAA